MRPGRKPALPPVDAPEPQRTPSGLAQASCSDSEDPEVFFDGDREAEAKSLCAGCPVVSACLVYATWNEEFGVWGGASAEEREALRGGAVVMDPEVRQRASDLRANLSSGMTHAKIASKWNVTVRTIERWAQAGRQLNEAA
jgi:WhiB family redox-sensing transcriptional regulator